MDLFDKGGGGSPHGNHLDFGGLDVWDWKSMKLVPDKLGMGAEVQSTEVWDNFIFCDLGDDEMNLWNSAPPYSYNPIDSQHHIYVLH